MTSSTIKRESRNMSNNKPKQTLYVNSYAGIGFSKVFDSYQAAFNFRETWKTEVGRFLPMNPHNGFVYSCDIVPGASVEASVEDRLEHSLNVR